MALVLHKVLSDGSVAHEEFSKELWESAMHDPIVKGAWGHRPGDCFDPAERTIKNRPKAEQVTVEIAPEETTKVAPPAEVAVAPQVAEPIVWPPDSKMTPWQLTQLTGLCADDCRDILLKPPQKVERDRPPLADKRGQFLLF